MNTSRPLSKNGKTSKTRTWLSGLWALCFLYLFLCAINVMGAGLKGVGKGSDWLETIIAQGTNPVVALLGGVLVTSVVQSSSFTTSLIITLVAAGQMEIETAVFAVMGANIGTSITGLIVSLGTMRIKRQFRRAYATALMHAIPNILTVLILFPIEWISSLMMGNGRGILANIASWAANLIGFSDVTKPTNPIKLITKPVVNLIQSTMDAIGGDGSLGASVAVAVCGLLLLFLALVFLVKNLKGAVLSRLEGLFSTVFFRNDFVAWLSGIFSTISVQSSSVTTSLLVPITGAGAVKLKRAFPFLLGCNIGTTVTGVIAALANPTHAAVTVAIAHVIFNFCDNSIWYPLRRIPIRMSKAYSRLACQSPKWAFIFLGTVFVVVPIIGLAITEWLFF
ncbi:MAG: Na/Pi symporter [Phycisphaerales bacterium]|jgi:sodium-dependent phosphate cotransporter|nr:Na/Pi symporter [Phycisphaerales bacterium]